MAKKIFGIDTEEYPAAAALFAGFLGVCLNCNSDDAEMDQEFIHQAPCVFCSSDAHSGCQHVWEA